MYTWTFQSCPRAHKVKPKYFKSPQWNELIILCIDIECGCALNSEPWKYAAGSFSKIHAIGGLWKPVLQLSEMKKSSASMLRRRVIMPCKRRMLTFFSHLWLAQLCQCNRNDATPRQELLWSYRNSDGNKMQLHKPCRWFTFNTPKREKQSIKVEQIWWLVCDIG